MRQVIAPGCREMKGEQFRVAQVESKSPPRLHRDRQIILPRDGVGNAVARQYVAFLFGAGFHRLAELVSNFNPDGPSGSLARL